MEHRGSVNGLLVGTLVALLAAVPAGAQQVEYYHLDALGSVRAVTDGNGDILTRHEYYPFGEEWNAPPSAAARRFTGKERDSETGHDYFGARYYGSGIGRFTTVDPFLDAQAFLEDPQQWNRYAYSQNNPLKFVDPDGRHPIVIVLALAAAFVLNNPANTNVTQGPTHDPIIPNSLIVTAGYGLTVGGVRAAGREVFEEVLESATGLPVGGLPSKPSEAYDPLRHYGRTPTKADRRALGADADEVVDHDPALVKPTMRAILVAVKSLASK